MTFEVRGSGPFPIDMLRYDRCWPARESEDSATIDASHRVGSRRLPHGLYTVRLESDRKEQPTVGRWESFGFKVVR